MSGALKLEFAPSRRRAKGVLVVFCDEGRIRLGRARDDSSPPGIWSLVRRRPTASRARTARRSTSWRRPGLKASRLVVVGTGKAARPKAAGFRQAGRHRHGQDSGRGHRGDGRRRPAGRCHEARPGRRCRARGAAARLCVRPLQDQAQGRRETPAQARGDARGPATSPARAKALAPREAVADGVMLARDLVNEPPNVLYPDEFARRAGELREARRRRRGARRQGDEEARHGRAARRRARARRTRAASRDHALERRQERRRRRSPSSARASASIPAAFRSSPPPAWRT